MCTLPAVDWFDPLFPFTHTVAETLDAIVESANHSARALPRRKRARCVIVTFDDSGEPAKITDRPHRFAAILAKCDPFQSHA